MPTHIKSRLAFSLFLLGALLINLSSAAPPQFDADKLAAIAPGMKHFVDEQKMCGAVLLVGTSQGVSYLETVGNQSLDGKPMPKDAIFRIMSMTKPITAMSIMLLRDEGKLSIDDPVEKYLPEFKGQMLLDGKEGDTVTLKKPARPITIKDLLTHTGGVPDYPPSVGSILHKQDHTLGEAVAISSQRPLDFEPGTKWKYSSSGIDALGHIVEVITGQPFEDYVKAKFFDPLQMNDTGFYITSQQLPRLAAVCGLKEGKLIPAEDLPDSHVPDPIKKPKYVCPAGGLYSTAADLSKLCQALLNGGQLNGHRIIAEKTLHEMTQNQTGDIKAGFVPGSAWGLGFILVDHPEGVTEALSSGTFGHGGYYGTQEWIDPVKDVYYVLLYQRAGLGNGDGSPMRKEFQDLAAAAIKP